MQKREKKGWEKEESTFESEGKEELMKNGKQGLCNATHMRKSACANVSVYNLAMM